jgi:hypothetical protein
MQSRATRRFWRQLAGLPEAVQIEARRAYRIFRTNSAHPSLHFKKLEGEEAIYSARVGIGYRALAVRSGDRVVWYWVGTHAEYDRLV